MMCGFLLVVILPHTPEKLFGIKVQLAASAMLCPDLETLDPSSVRGRFYDTTKGCACSSSVWL